MQIDLKDLGASFWDVLMLVMKVIGATLGFAGIIVWWMARDYISRVKLLETQIVADAKSRFESLEKNKVNKEDMEERVAALQMSIEQKFAGMSHLLEMMRDDGRVQFDNLRRTIEHTANDANSSRQSLSSRIDTLIDNSRINNQDRR